jgi:peroxiredoxin
LGISLFLVLALSWQNRGLKEEIGRVRDLATKIHPGFHVPFFSARDIHGKEAVIGSPDSGRSQILFFLKTDCDFCYSSLPKWERIFQHASAHGHQALGIALDSLKPSLRFAEAQGIPFPLIPLPEKRIPLVFRVPGVPFTLVVDDQGRVTYSEIGVPTNTSIDSIVSILNSRKYVDINEFRR